ncbi:MAG: pteridine reductase [Methylococcales symbiont of Hymedesmia sp. n. MRB-2018]|nr:MAG: pteridine reductase [Methylococcales symbiont of Hymedesmia sp. n. MRB-2018]KAF3984604.1 MAG: pteridine reductase [Methylococcales symbiont of Hymedesmia sp. n. MRB-2018]
MKNNVLITGAAKRIGASCARMLHQQGCNIFLHYRSSEQDAFQLFEELSNIRADSVKIMQADLLKLDEISKLAEQAEAAWGSIDILINNASAFYPQSIQQVSERDWDELLSINLKAPFFLSQKLSSTLIATKGSIINIIDIHAERGLKGYPVYSIAKAGLAAMTKVLAKELGPEVRVNGVSPGAILWPETELSDQNKAEILHRVALNRNGEPDDIAKTVCFLAKDASYITGQIIAVDGGRTLFC